MAGRRELAHVGADLGEDDLSDAAFDPGDRVEEVNRCSKRANHLPDVVAQSFDGLIKVLQVSKQFFHQNPVSWGKPARERLARCGKLLAQTPARKIGEDVGVMGAADEP